MTMVASDEIVPKSAKRGHLLLRRVSDTPPDISITGRSVKTPDGL